MATVLAFITVIVIGLLCAGGYVLYNNMAGNAVVPYLYNMNVDEAKKLIAEKGFVLGDTELAPSDTVDVNNVISQNPAARTQAKKGTVVSIVVSSGNSGGNIDVPYVINDDPTDAITKIMELGLTYEIKDENSSTVAEGKISRQLPDAGTKLNAGDIVTIYKSLGPKVQIEVPNLSGYTREMVESTLSSLGLKLGKISADTSDKPVNTVISQIPADGSAVDEGSFVSIVISSGSTGQTGTVATAQPGGTDAAAQQPSSNAQQPSGNVKKNITFKVPGEEGTSKVTVLVNGQAVVDGDYSCGSDVEFEIPYSEPVEVIVYINGEEASRQKFNQ